MPPRQRNPALGILWQPLEIGVAPDDPNGCYVYMAYEWIALFRALFDLLDHDWVWKNNPSQMRQWVQDIQFQLTCELPKEIIEKEVVKSSVKSVIYAIAYQELSEMFDFDIEDYVRVTEDGLLQLNIDGCSDCNWTTIWDLNGGAVSKTYDKILDEAGNLIDRAFSGVTSGADLPQKTSPDEDIARCSKATAYAEIVWGYLAAFAETYTTLNIGGIDSDDFNLLSVANSVLGVFAEAMSFAPSLTPFLGVAEVGGVVLAMSQQLEQELQEFVENEANKQKLICFYYKAFTQREALVGEDVSRAINRLDETTMGVTAEFLGVIKKVMRYLPIKETSAAVNAARVSNNCGCPDAIPSNPLDAPNKPSAAIWSVEADLKTGQHGTRLFEVSNPQWGEYVQGEGYVNSSYPFDDVPDAIQFTRIYIDWQNLTGRILRVDWLAENVVEGLFQSNAGTPNADIEKFLVYVTADGQPTQYVENGAGWQTANFGHTFANMNLWYFWGYCEVGSQQGGQTSLGQGTVTKIRIHGTGTKPAWFAANGWQDV